MTQEQLTLTGEQFDCLMTKLDAILARLQALEERSGTITIDMDKAQIARQLSPYIGQEMSREIRRQGGIRSRP